MRKSTTPWVFAGEGPNLDGVQAAFAKQGGGGGAPLLAGGVESEHANLFERVTTAARKDELVEKFKEQHEVRLYRTSDAANITNTVRPHVPTLVLAMRGFRFDPDADESVYSVVSGETASAMYSRWLLLHIGRPHAVDAASVGAAAPKWPRLVGDSIVSFAVLP